jgi:thiamine pyrophosphate-dependent acetolactate synthase large subunit-like protein
MTYSLGELATLAQEGLNVTVVVLNNGAMGWIKWEQAVYWNGKFQSTDLSEVDFSVVAQGLGCKGHRVQEPADLRDALAQALASADPSLIDVKTAVTEASVDKFSGATRAKELMRQSPPC